MSLIANVFWECPGCGSREQAQVNGERGDPMEFPVDAVPVSRGLRWNPPCQKCGKFRLELPETRVAYLPVPARGKY